MTVTSLPLEGDRAFDSKVSNFAEEVYVLEPSTHLYKLMQTLLGDPGVGGLKKAQAAARIGEQLQSTWFGDLDVFFGTLMGVPRLSSEQYGYDPWGTQLTLDQWDEVAIKDALYRARLSLMLQAIVHGGTEEGVRLAAEAACGLPCQIFECWRIDEGALQTAGRLDDQREFVVIPYDDLDPELERAVYKAVALLQPVNSICTVSAAGVGNLVDVRDLGSVVSASSPSEYFEMVRRVHAPKGNA